LASERAPAGQLCHHSWMGLSNRLSGSGFLAAAVYASLLIVPLASAPAGAQPADPTPVPVIPGPGPAPDSPAPPAAPAPLAAPGCPDVEVVFARGTTEAPGIGAMGQAFVDDLRPKLGARTVGVYAVDYPASPDFPTAVQGITDASTHVQEMAANCPDTQLVLGGYSQGAAVMGFVTTELVPDGVSASEVPAPMPPDIAEHVSAVALLGTPSDRFMTAIAQPAVTIGPLYEPKTLELCVPNDFVCSPGNDFAAHARYVSDGLVMQAADFAAAKVAESTPGA